MLGKELPRRAEGKPDPAPEPEAAKPDG